MPQFKMYQQLSDGREQLVSLFDSDRDEITAVRGAKPVRMHAAPPARKAAPAPPKAAPTPRQQKLTLAQAASTYGLCQHCLYPKAHCHCALHQPDTLGRVVAMQRKQGVRP